MARKDLFLHNGAYFFDDSRNPKRQPQGYLLRKWLIKALRSMGIPVVDPCCENEDGLYPLIYNTATGQDGIMLNGVFVAVETASGASTTTTTSTTTTIPPTTTTTSTTSSTTSTTSSTTTIP